MNKSAIFVVLQKMVALFLHILFAHKYFVSITEAQYKPEDHVVEISITMTGHDVEQWINDHHISLQSLEELPEDSVLNEKVQTLFLNNFSIKSDGETLPIQIVGSEILSDDSFNLYLIAETPEEAKVLQFRNNLLVSSFPNQENIIHFISENSTTSKSIKQNVTSVNFDL